MTVAPTKSAARLYAARLCAAALACLCPCVAANTPALVSIDQDGRPGNHDSSFAASTGTGQRAQVLDDGTVFFISRAALDAENDENVLADFYRRQTGHTEVLDLPGTALGDCHIAWVDWLGQTCYLFREMSIFDPGYELLTGALEAKTSAGIQTGIVSAAYAGNGEAAAYEKEQDGRSDIFLHILTTRSREQINLTAPFNDASRAPALSDNGARLVFAAHAWNIVPGDTNGCQDIFVYDHDTGTFAMISVRRDNDVNHDAEHPAISGDGQVVAFASSDDSFVTGDTNGCKDIFVHDGAGTTRCSLTDTGAEPGADSDWPQLNGDGRFVVFASRAELVAGMGAGVWLVYVYDRENARTECLSLNAVGDAADRDCLAPAISPNGRYVTFVSRATNLSDQVDDDSVFHVYRIDRGTTFTNHVPSARDQSLSTAADTAVDFTLQATDADGDALTFTVTDAPAHGALTRVADGTGITPGVPYTAESMPWRYTPATADIFVDTFSFTAGDGLENSAEANVTVRMLEPGQGFITRVSLAADGNERHGDSYDAGYPGLGISADGGRLVFASQASLVSEDADTDSDVFMAMPHADAIGRLSTESAPGQNAYFCAISGNGCRAVFYTQDHGGQLILQDLDAGTRTVVDSGLGAALPSRPALSHDGKRIIYIKYDTDTFLHQAYLRDMAVATPVLVSVAPTRAAADGNCWDPAISADGNVVTFVSTATNLVTPATDGRQFAFWRNLAEQQTHVVSLDATGAPLTAADAPATLSATGRYVAFADLELDSLSVHRRDVPDQTTRVIAIFAGAPAISADGRFVYYRQQGANDIWQAYRVDTANPPNRAATLVSHAPDGSEGNDITYVGALSAGGRYAAFASDATNLVTMDNNASRDIFLSDLGTPQNQLPVPQLTHVTVAEDDALAAVALPYADNENNDAILDIVQPPQHAAVFAVHTIMPGRDFPRFDYTPAANYCGSDSFYYRYGDAGGWSATTRVDIQVTPVNDPPTLGPVPAPDPRDIDEGRPLTIALNVGDADLQNAPPHTDALTFSVSPPGWGEIAIDAQGNPVYTFTPGYATVARGAAPVSMLVTLRVEDAAGAAAEQTLTVRVSDRNAVPSLTVTGALALDPNAGEGQITAALINVVDDDDDNADIVVTFLETPTVGKIVHGAQPLHDGDSVAYGQFPLVYTAPEDEAGMVQIRLQAADAQGGTTAAETLNIAYGDTRLRIEWRDGWNAFALPFTPEITDPRVLFARPDGTGVWYSGELWEWNARLQVFRVARTLRAGTGYYAHCRTGSPVRFMVALDPTVFPNGRIELARKWSFVGAHGFGEKTARITDAAGRPFPNRRIYECTPDAQARFAADGKLRRARAGWFYSPTPQIIELRLNHQ